MNGIRFTLSLLVLAVATPAFASSVSSESAGGLTSYSENFESADFAGETIGSGWLFFNTVFEGDTNLFSYSGEAPNGPQISALVNDQGASEQGTQQLSVYSDYECCQPDFGHNSTSGIGYVVTNVYQEQLIGSDNAGERWTLSFDLKRGNIEGPSRAFAFLRVIDPANGFSVTDEAIVETTGTPDQWNTVSITLTLGDWQGQLMQFGFSTSASNFYGSGIFYDNVDFRPAPVPVPAAFWLLASGLLGLVSRRSRTA